MKEIVQILEAKKEEILAEWLRQPESGNIDLGGITVEEIRLQSEAFLERLFDALAMFDNAEVPKTEELMEFIRELAAYWNKMEVTPEQISIYFLSIAPIIYETLKREESDLCNKIDDVVFLENFISSLSLSMYHNVVQMKEEIIRKQELAFKKIDIPVLRLDKNTILIPIVGIMDSEKAMNLMKKTLNAIRDLEVHNVIIDIEGVPLIDTDVAGQLVKLESASRMMGAKLIISGFSPKVAETMVHLGIDLHIPTTSILQYAIEKFRNEDH